MGRSFSPKTIVHYTIFAAVVLIGYKMFIQKDKKESNPFSGSEHPRNLHVVQKPPSEADQVKLQEGIKETVDEVVKDVNEGNSKKSNISTDEKAKTNMHVGDLPKAADERDMDDLINEREKMKYQKSLEHQYLGANEDTGKGKQFHADGVDWELEAEMKKRRAKFLEYVNQMEEELEENEFKDMHESDSDFAFVTAGSHSTYLATIEFIYSVQYFFPTWQIAIFDIGLKSEERDFINSLCNTEVSAMWLQFWPEALYKIRHRVWRPLVLQFALAKYGHFIYLEPGRFVNRQTVKEYLAHSRKHGVTVGGRQLKHSSFVVTSPHMYSFLKVDERKLQRTPHFDFTLLILHNTKRVRNYFMRYLFACAMEDYCIAPPGSKPKCDPNMSNNKRYANCHRYDESAINIILNQWHHYKAEEFLVKDKVSKYFDGRDMVHKVKVCKRDKEEI